MIISLFPMSIFSFLLLPLLSPSLLPRPSNCWQDQPSGRCQASEVCGLGSSFSISLSYCPSGILVSHLQLPTASSGLLDGQNPSSGTQATGGKLGPGAEGGCKKVRTWSPKQHCQAVENRISLGHLRFSSLPFPHESVSPLWGLSPSALPVDAPSLLP